MIIIYVIVAVIAGFFLMAPLAWLFETMRWPMFNKWELAHGYWLLAWPMLSLLSLLGILAAIRGPGPRSH